MYIEQDDFECHTAKKIAKVCEHTMVHGRQLDCMHLSCYSSYAYDT